MTMTSFRVSPLQNRPWKQLRDRVLARRPISRGVKAVLKTMIRIRENGMPNISKNSKIATHWDLSTVIKKYISKANLAPSYQTTRPKTSPVTIYQSKTYLLLCNQVKKTLATLCRRLRKKRSQMSLWSELAAKKLNKNQRYLEKTCLSLVGYPWSFIFRPTRPSLWKTS